MLVFIVPQVLFNCSTVANLTNITEPKTCHYEMIFHTPLACFKGAMQIFHLLPAEVMAKWETLEQEFYNGEWTLQVIRTGIMMHATVILIHA